MGTSGGQQRRGLILIRVKLGVLILQPLPRGVLDPPGAADGQTDRQSRAERRAAMGAPPPQPPTHLRSCRYRCSAWRRVGLTAVGRVGGGDGGAPLGTPSWAWVEPGAASAQCREQRISESQSRGPHSSTAPSSPHAAPLLRLRPPPQPLPQCRAQTPTAPLSPHTHSGAPTSPPRAQLRALTALTSSRTALPGQHNCSSGLHCIPALLHGCGGGARPHSGPSRSRPASIRPAGTPSGLGALGWRLSQRRGSGAESSPRPPAAAAVRSGLQQRALRDPPRPEQQRGRGALRGEGGAELRAALGGPGKGRGLRTHLSAQRHLLALPLPHRRLLSAAAAVAAP